MSRYRARCCSSIWILIFCLWATAMTTAQQTEVSTPQAATIIGTVLDANGATVPNASVLLQGSVPNDQRTLVTRDNGFFQLEGVKPGLPYHVVVRAPGFAAWTSQDLVLRPGQFFILKGIQLRLSAVQISVNAETPEQVAVEQVKAAEQQRIIGFIPNFYVSYDHNPVPLSAKLKWHLALRALVDPVTILGFGLNAGIYQAADHPSYQQGAKGYGQRLGATFAGGYTNVLVGDAILPSLLHQDPRYFYQGTGTTKSRLWHALSSPFVTRSDDGQRQINYSNIGGDLASGAMANAYYPSGDRGPGLVVSSALIGAGGRMANAVLQEFVLHKFTSRHDTQNQTPDRADAH
jgi:Carboxypeptidase regulatory-like domain